MSTDRELLVLAAKAAGVKMFSYIDSEMFGTGINSGEVDVSLWNPLTDDGDALRLAVKRGIKFKYNAGLGQGLAWDFFGNEHQANVEDCGGCPNAATRRAIVRAAAEIGRAQ